MKRLSLSKTLKDSQKAALRFPAVLLCAVAAAVVGIILVEQSASELPLIKALMACVLAMVLSLNLALAFEGNPRGKLIQWAGVPLAALYWLLLPETVVQSDTIRFFILLVGAHFFLACAPFVRRGEDLAVWQFNTVLILRLLASLIFTMVLFSGLSLALLALDTLLGVDLDDDLYLELYIVLVFVFHTWFFIGGVPENPRSLAVGSGFPRPVRVFAQHILSSLVVVYLAILMAYLVKIVVTGVWPSGWIGWLVSSVAVAGYLSLLLLFPLQKDKQQTWIKIYFRLFHILMIPAAVMLALAISKRVGQYGVTELRYLLMALVGWLMVMLLWGLLRQKVLVRWIPLSLSLLLLLAGLGPLDAVSVSLRSQKGRLQNQLETAGMLHDGVLQPRSEKLEDSKLEEIQSSIRHLVKNNGRLVLKDWFTPDLWQSLEQRMKSNPDQQYNYWWETNEILQVLNLDREAKDHSQVHRLDRNLKQGDNLAIDGFDDMVIFNLSSGNSFAFQWDGVAGKLELNARGNELTLSRNELQEWVLALDELFATLWLVTEERSLPNQTDWVFDAETAGWQVRLLINRIHYKKTEDGPQIRLLEASLFMREPQP